MRAHWEVMKDAVRQLRKAAAVTETIVRLKGDEGGRLAVLAKEHRTTAEELEDAARRLTPSRALLNWGRGETEAAKNWHPGNPARPS